MDDEGQDGQEPEFAPADQLAVVRAQVDQAGAMAPLVAQLHDEFYRAMCEKGFGERQALYLTAAWFNDSPGTPPS